MRITIPRHELIALGARLRGPYLVQQAGYTLAIASEEEGELEAVAGDPRLLEDVGAASAQVSAAIANRTVMAEEAKALTGEQDRLVAEAKVWRRKVVTRGHRASRVGGSVPDALLRLQVARSVPALLADITRMTASFEANVEVMGGASAAALLEEGKRLNVELGRIDAAQESKRLAELPATVQDYYVAKATLYLGLKVIHDAGHELHAGDRARASRYNLTILHRRRRKRAPAAEPVE